MPQRFPRIQPLTRLGNKVFMLSSKMKGLIRSVIQEGDKKLTYLSGLVDGMRMKETLKQLQKTRLNL